MTDLKNYTFLRDITKENPFKINFVCLGNICRSPTGEGVMQYLVKERGWESHFFIDSSGTGAWHVGEPANSKSQATANRYGVHLSSRARQFKAYDLEDFDLILAMDKSNYRDIHTHDRKNQSKGKLFLMREFDPIPGDMEVPDPYYGGMEGFDQVYKMVHRTCENLLHLLHPYVK